jgi:hypothetical protein
MQVMPGIARQSTRLVPDIRGHHAKDWDLGTKNKNGVRALKSAIAPDSNLAGPV